MFFMANWQTAKVGNYWMGKAAPPVFFLCLPEKC
jgi:hypothetical protein